jgi:SAM-dependent methyltransferase
MRVGRHMSYLPPLDYTGVDLNEKHIANARELHGDRGRFIVGNAADDLKQEEKEFDLINVSALLHHIADSEAISLFASLKRLLKPNGRIVTIDNVWLPKQRVAVPAALLKRRRLPRARLQRITLAA